MFRKIALCVLSFCFIAVCSAETAPWRHIFNGNDLSGWHQKNGDAVYEVSEGAIVGKTVRNTPNSFLCTNNTYSDFILKLKFKVDSKLNSGVQIRSRSLADYRNYRVHGYQVEIDPSSRAWTGGIYDEARRGWLHPLSNGEPASKSFKQNEWNEFRIEAIGNTFKTWLNGKPASHLEDDMTKEGFIGLQVHSIGGDKSKEGIKVMWKDIQIITDNPEKYSKPISLPKKDLHNKLTSNERRGGWELLFDGESTDKWRGAKLETFPSFGWYVHDGILTIKESGGGEAANAGDIVTKKQFKDFELRVDFKITPGANSGIKYYVDTEINKGPGSSIGLEYQILDDKRHPDAKKGNHEGSRTLASLYDLIMAVNKHPNPMGEWNHARIVSKDNHIQHWLNGRKVLEYERRTPKFRKLVKESKYVKWDNFGELPKGNILLQDHGNRVSFRNIKIRELK
ncbi:hypothetical protein L21SP3_00716 [Sedimentisphaera cyanobacteriorum]|uniref:3-keto-alpha-glucoside-1,2-lyase/3-keto-2-hydroxy-glucal hydratase domain-containing protein n=1 Tax=Sedimentisphaera cyanobacteriorum TaxID=1940790 RepID=A0A1Q2HNX4_9BACT|nr:DUF1080 domain-containing protein [Sedimentisphaera cyanobacteriorum]AQQ08923.1 hypothetical protein L21SP3_00716 [Sedimentisphaera cyanobacteriorum]